MKLTKKKALEITIELWTFLAETGKKKSEWDGWKKYGRMRMGCPLCEYNNLHPLEDGCNCPFDKFEDGCEGEELSFGKWEEAETIEERKKFAGEFLNQLKEVNNA